MCGKHPLMGPEGQQRVELRQWQLVSSETVHCREDKHWVVGEQQDGARFVTLGDCTVFLRD